ncbi:MAG TPA: hypothetical protein VFQ35_02515, partial [Polyangiaceae bacterium]|nr:hypothetical protein [Polyangiaceae bacterium]
SAVVGALQSGALSYFSNGCPLIVGLDGVVDPNAAAAVRARTLSDYAAARGVTHFADWQYNRSAFAALSEHSKWTPGALELVTAASPQGPDRFELMSVTWPEGAPVASTKPKCAP